MRTAGDAKADARQEEEQREGWGGGVDGSSPDASKFTENGVLRKEWAKLRLIILRREGGVWRKPETRAGWEPGEGSDEVLEVWEGARQHLAFVAYHETEAGTVFIDRLHTCEGATYAPN